MKLAIPAHLVADRDSAIATARAKAAKAEFQSNQYALMMEPLTCKGHIFPVLYMWRTYQSELNPNLALMLQAT